MKKRDQLHQMEYGGTSIRIYIFNFLDKPSPLSNTFDVTM